MEQYTDYPVKIPGRLESAAVGGIVADAKNIYDIEHQKKQSEINEEIEKVPSEIERIDGALNDRYTKEESYNKTEIGNKESGLQNQIDAIKGGSSKSINTLDTEINGDGGINERLQTVEQLGTISVGGGDIGIATASDFENPTPEQRAKVPTVGAILDIADDTPTVGSENLVKSGGVADLFLTDVPIETTWESGKIMDASGYPVAMYEWSISDSFILDEGVTITGVFGSTNSGYSVCAFFDEGAEMAFQRFAGTGEEQTFTVPRRCYVRLSVSDTANPTHSIFVPGLIDLKQLSDDVEYIKEQSGIKKSIWEGKKVGFLGDSTSASGTSTYVENYAALTGCLAQNYAIGGTSVADNGQPNPMCTRYSVLPADLDMVLILGGVNDHRLGIPLGNFEDFNNDGSLNGTFYGALHTLIRGLKIKYLDKPIVYMTPMHNNYRDGTYGDTGEYNYNQLQLGKLVENKFPLNNGNVDETTATGGTLSEYILAIKKVCSFYGVPVIDLHDICGIQPIIPANKTQYLPDGIHPTTQAGGKRMAEAVYPYLEQIYQ